MKKFFLPGLLILGIIARFATARLGHTYDMESYEIVAKIVLSGGNVYAETTRYNYGPFWFMVLAAFYKIAQWFPNPFIFFRYEIIALLTAVDLGIYSFLKRYVSPKAGLFYFLNPISIIVTGYYNQFDGIALLLGLIAAQIYEKRTFKGLVIMGVSLAFKHVFFLFPLWIAIRERSMRRRILAIGVPLGIFFASFIPFVKTGFLGIINNVFFYLSFRNAPLWNMAVPDSVKLWINQYTFFLMALVVGAFVLRKKNLLLTLMFYCILLVLFSPAIGEQYFVYALPYISVFVNPLFIAFTFVQTIFMFLMVAGGETYVSVLRMLIDRANFGFSLQMTLLGTGLLYSVLRLRLKKLSIKQWIVILLAAHLAFAVFYTIPDMSENRKVKSIELAISLGDYETANALYSTIEKNPPFAGSRFWNKLARSRYYISYYRNYRKAKNTVNKDQIRLLLKGEPPNFFYREDVKEMLESTQ